MKYKIYKLVHPSMGVVYIGITTMSLEKRKKVGSYKGCSVEKVADECSIELIEETDDRKREQYWIEQHTGLLNKNKGFTGISKKDYFKEYEKKYREKPSRKEYQKKYQKAYREKQKNIKKGLVDSK
jgi:hypothetical protein